MSWDLFMTLFDNCRQYTLLYNITNAYTGRGLSFTPHCWSVIMSKLVVYISSIVMPFYNICSCIALWINSVKWWVNRSTGQLKLQIKGNIYTIHDIWFVNTLVYFQHRTFLIHLKINRNIIFIVVHLIIWTI